MKTQAIVLLAIICLASSASTTFLSKREARALTGEPTTSYEIRMWNMYAGRCEDKCLPGCDGACADDEIWAEGIDTFCRDDCEEYWNGSEFPRY